MTQRQDAPHSTIPWSNLLWHAPAEARIGTDELSAVLRKSRSWIYKHTMQGAANRLPHRKLGNSLVFVVGEVRKWIEEMEKVG
jgi:predicted DNA-binding transcriptional regulator AlpA